MPPKTNKYDESTIKSLNWKEHIRIRPGMYIGKLGNGSSFDDGIYILFKEVIDNSIDEHIMGYCNKIDIEVKENSIYVRDYGRGIPLGKVEDCVSKINTGGKYDTEAFQKSVGLNGVGLKAVNALSDKFYVKSIRDKEMIFLEYIKGKINLKEPIQSSNEKNGTLVVFKPDSDIFRKYQFLHHHLENQILYYVYLNSGLVINYNNNKYFSENGL